MIGHKWQRITRLDSNCGYDFTEIDSLQHQWLNVKEQREAAYPQAYAVFMERLGRSWAIETGIIEGLYSLDRGVTETLVERGISADLIDRGATNRDPHELVSILRDHQDAAEGVYLEIREGKPISRSSIRQIHSVFARHQPTYRAVDRFGRWFDAELHRGEFKRLPNNPARNDGTVHEYCPPEHVDSELDSLLEWYDQYQKAIDVYHPILSGAWLHHRFTQIHPFQDGNGRVARALLTWHLVREGYLPAVIKRDDRDRYIETLESGDQGNLYPFVDFLVRLQKQTMLEALAGPGLAAQPGLVDQALDHIVGQINLNNEAKDNQMRSVSRVAQAVRDMTASLLAAQADQVTGRLSEAGRKIQYAIDRGGPGNNEHWYRDEVIQTANNSRHWVNLNEPRFFVRLSFTPEKPSRYPRLILVISLHQIGRQLTGITAATAFALVQHYHAGSTKEIEEVGALFEDCTLDPFTFTWENNAESVFQRFSEWAEQRLAIAVTKWGQYLT